MPGVLNALVAFVAEHQRCGDLDGGGTTRLFVTLRVSGADAGRGMQGLVHVADQVKQPDQVVGLERIGIARAQHAPEEGNALLGVRRRDRWQRGPVLRERGVDEVALDQPESGPLGPRPGDFHSPLVELCGGPFWASYGLS